MPLCEHCKHEIYFGARTGRTQGRQEDSSSEIQMWRHLFSESPTCARKTPTPLPQHLEVPPDTRPALAKKLWEGG